MHILLEEHIRIVTKLLLRECIIVQSLFSIDDFNNKLNRFEFGDFRSDEPASILNYHMHDKNPLRVHMRCIHLTTIINMLIHKRIVFMKDIIIQIYRSLSRCRLVILSRMIESGKYLSKY